jgi:glutathionyl-hydroquinone reductase
VTKLKVYKQNCYYFDIVKNKGCSARRTAQPGRYFMYFPKYCPVYHSRLMARKGKEHGDKIAKERKKIEESMKE